MAIIEKNFLDWAGLQTYDEKIKEYASAIRQIVPEYDSTTQTLSFLEDAGVNVVDDELIFVIH